MLRRWLLFLLALAACGDPAPSLGDLGTRQAEAICARAAACCDAVDLDFAYEATSAQTCEAKITLANQAVAGYLRDWETDGLASFDATLAETCLADLAGLSCREFAELIVNDPWTPMLCGVVPRVADGGACSDSRQCTSGLCGNAYPRTCVAMPGLGDPCDGTCAAGFFCGATGCERQLDIGEPCDLPVQCEDGDCLIDSGTGIGACARPDVCEG